MNETEHKANRNMPDWKAYVRENLAPLRLAPERELEMVEEMAQHLEAIYEEALADGASGQEAFTRATAHIKDWRLLECELIRARRPTAAAWINRRSESEAQVQSQKTKSGGIAMGSLAQDLRYGFRMLLKSKAFTAVAVLSLALGIGANTAIFSLIDAVLLKPLPVKNPNELVIFDWLSGPNPMARSISGYMNMNAGNGMQSSTAFAYEPFKQFNAHSETLSDVFAFAAIEQLNVNVGGRSEIASGQVVSGGYYAGLGVQAVAGRTLTDSDDQDSAEPVAVISYRYWQRRFGLDPAALGASVNFNGVPFTIVGVTPRGFEGALEIGNSPDVSMALNMEPRINKGGSLLREPGNWWLLMMGRLKAGATADQARSNLEGIFQQSAIEDRQASKSDVGHEEPGPPDVPNLRVFPGSQGQVEARREYSQPLMILMAVVGLTLLIACANVANLLLARGATRQKEMAVRMALGASRMRLIRQLLTESVLLALLGGLLGVLFAYYGKDILLTLRPWGGGPLEIDLKLDLRILGFTAGVSLLTGVIFGIAPALRSARLDLNPALKDGARSVIGGSGFKLTKALVVVQVALSLVLLVGAGLFVRTLHNLHSVDLGFNRHNLLLFRVDPQLSGYKKAQIGRLYEELIEHIQAVPGVVHVSLSRHALLSGGANIRNAFVEGQPAPSERPSMRDATWVQSVRSNFFETMEIPIVAGRGFTPQDDERAPKVAVINQRMAHRYFGDESPLGKRFGFRSAEHSKDLEIVGVARDAKYSSVRGDVPFTAYQPYAQESASLGQMNFEVRTGGDPTALAGAIREAVSEVDKNVPLFDVRTQSQQADQSLAQERLFATLSTFFGLLALVLACIGLYGVMAFAVARRTNEIGIRMALGATAPRVGRMVMRETMLLVLVGIAIGLGVAVAVTRLIEGMLFGLAANDPVTISFAALLMILVAALAGYLPARRAAKVDPMIALRYE